MRLRVRVRKDEESRNEATCHLRRPVSRGSTMSEPLVLCGSGPTESPRSD